MLARVAILLIKNEVLWAIFILKLSSFQYSWCRKCNVENEIGEYSFQTKLKN